MTGARLHRHESGSQETLVVANRVHRREQRVDRAIPAEHPHLHRLLKLLAHLLLAHALLLHRPITIRLVHGPHQHRINLTGTHILGEWRITSALLLLEESRLQILAHVLSDSLLRITLHTGVDGGVNLQAIRIKIVELPIRLLVLIAPAIERIGFPREGVFAELLRLPRGIILPVRLLRRQCQTQVFTEIGSQAILVIHAGEMQGQREGTERVTIRLAQIARFLHLA